MGTDNVGITREDVVQEARTWIGTPFRPQMRDKGVGCDCVGVALGVGWVFGVTEFDSHHYPKNGADSGKILEHLDRLTNRVPRNEMKPGDLVCLSFHGEPPIHVGILTHYRGRQDALGIVHAMTNVGFVREHRLSPDWRQKIVRVYRLPGVVD